MIMLCGPGLVGPGGSSFMHLQSLLVLSLPPITTVMPFFGISPFCLILYYCLVHVAMGDASLATHWRWVANYSLLLGGELPLDPSCYILDTVVSWGLLATPKGVLGLPMGSLLCFVPSGWFPSGSCGLCPLSYP